MYLKFTILYTLSIFFPCKLLDVSKLHSYGWKHKIELREGIASVYEQYAPFHA